MRLIHQLDKQGLPPADLEFRLATDILGTTNPLLRRVIEHLVATPKRFSELKPLLAARKSENHLTLALKRLRGEGLVDRRIDGRTPTDAYVYELTPLGVEVLFTMKHLEFANAAQFWVARPGHEHGASRSRA